MVLKPPNGDFENICFDISAEKLNLKVERG